MAHSRIYCDPPYLGAGYSEYYGIPFSKQDHLDLVGCAKAAVQLGAKVIISNNDTEETRDLYKDAEIVTFTVYRPVSNSSKPAEELLAIYA